MADVYDVDRNATLKGELERAGQEGASLGIRESVFLASYADLVAALGRSRIAARGLPVRGKNAAWRVAIARTPRVEVGTHPSGRTGIAFRDLEFSLSFTTADPPDETFTAYTLTYDEVFCVPVVEADAVRLRVMPTRGALVSTSRDEAAIARHWTDAGEFDRYELVGSSEAEAHVARSFIESLAVPNVLEELGSWRLAPVIATSVKAIAGQSWIFFSSCPERGDESPHPCERPLVDPVARVVDREEEFTDEGGSARIRFEFPRVTGRSHGIEPWLTEDAPGAIGALHLASTRVLAELEGEIQIPDTFSYSNYFLAVDYGYDGSVRPNNIRRAIDAATGRIDIEADLMVNAQAYAGITVACVSYRVDLATVEGKIRDVHIALAPTIEDGWLKLKVIETGSGPADVTIRCWPAFPMDVVASVLLDHLATVKARAVVRKLASRLERRLLRVDGVFGGPNRAALASLDETSLQFAIAHRG